MRCGYLCTVGIVILNLDRDLTVTGTNISQQWETAGGWGPIHHRQLPASDLVCGRQHLDDPEALAPSYCNVASPYGLELGLTVPRYCLLRSTVGTISPPGLRNAVHFLIRP